jgi:hypothetical protein
MRYTLTILLLITGYCSIGQTAYPLLKDISMMKGREPEPLMECNGFCEPNSQTSKPINNE